jgi:ectoine hydroxylase-related dioxygenase (phytanoyl-CoA dioxygenase family)
MSKVIALRVHLDDSIASNGPLRVLPGTHKLGVLDDESMHQLDGRTPAVE